jgi:hypothetical protein
VRQFDALSAPAKITLAPADNVTAAQAGETDHLTRSPVTPSSPNTPSVLSLAQRPGGAAEQQCRVDGASILLQ